jgi:phosphoglycolate phosphatase-like HAD superfamily hydrolase
MGDLLVLWDVDGTLLNAGGVGCELYGMVFSSMFGRPCERLAPMAGRTDRAIILETLVMAGVPDPRRHVDPFIEQLRSRAGLVFRATQRHGRILPGAAEAINALASARVTASTIGFAVPGAALPAPAPAPRPDAPLTDAALVEAAAAGIPVSVLRSAARPVPAGMSSTARIAAAVPYGAPADAGAVAPAFPGSAPPAPGPLAAPPGTDPAGAFPAGVDAPPVYPAALPVSRPASRSCAVGLPGAAPGPGHAAIPIPLSPSSRRRPESGRVFQSVLTGSVRSIAEVKLDAVGLHYPLDLCIGAYGDDHEVRAELVHLARRRAAAVYGKSSSGDFRGESTIVVGDTPLDIQAALAAGARAVGVATGGYPASALRAAGAHAVLTDLASMTAVLSAVLS